MQWKTGLGKSHLEISPVSLLKNFPFKNLSQEMTTVSPAFPLDKNISRKMVAVSPLFAFWKEVEPNSLILGGGARISWGKGQTT